MKKRVLLCAKMVIGVFLGVLWCGEIAVAQELTLTGIDRQMYEIAVLCRDEVRGELGNILNSGILSYNQLFDTFYLPIPGTSPQKYHTQYDKVTDERIRIILDKCLKMDSRLVYAVASDRNGYVPTHNSKYSQPLTDDPVFNEQNSRGKRIYSDRAGLAAARNTAEYLLQTYHRDTGEMLNEIAVPININGEHWGAFRVGYSR